ncbi:DUF1285 domain-containing protein [Paracoccus suum]|uniref:DUF1285 domain-containing protein n=1 Tax=Paracoccus suum TaxID=2259340 RepID=A0A344PM22_9RHOB|nr:DUF1285 domain-containing protein [Paracoccus suum]AXC50427.1 DUF1285 domain-containing protein [Paracoccus suum]
MAQAGGNGATAPDAAGIAAAASQAARRGPPPVHLWNPPFCGDLDMEIRADGSWFYLGTPIAREGMVRLFASVLKREGDRYFLVTPVEKVGLRVIDAPFVAVDAELDRGNVTFTTNVGETVTAGPGHEIRLTFGPDGTPRPYVHVRRGLDALIDRKTYYRLVEAASVEGGDVVLRSGGMDFVLGAA